MKHHIIHGQHMTTHGDEIPHLDIDPPTPFAACMAALILLIVAAAVIGTVVLVVLLPPGPWKLPLCGAAIAALWLMGRGQRA